MLMGELHAFLSDVDSVLIVGQRNIPETLQIHPRDCRKALCGDRRQQSGSAPVALRPL